MFSFVNLVFIFAITNIVTGQQNAGQYLSRLNKDLDTVYKFKNF